MVGIERVNVQEVSGTVRELVWAMCMPYQTAVLVGRAALPSALFVRGSVFDCLQTFVIMAQLLCSCVIGHD